MRKPLAALAVLSLTGCSWQQWVDATIHQGSYDNKAILTPDGNAYDRAAFAVLETSTVMVDDNCSGDSVCMDSLGDRDFWINHERGHIAYAKMGYPKGISAITQEQAANCIAEVVTGRDPNFTYDEAGYWNCPPKEVAYYRTILNTKLGITT